MLNSGKNDITSHYYEVKDKSSSIIKKKKSTLKKATWHTKTETGFQCIKWPF